MNAAQERVLNSLLSNTRFDAWSNRKRSTARPLIDRRILCRTAPRNLERAEAVRCDRRLPRNLQNSYIDLLSNKLNVRPSVTDDYRALIKQELRDLSAAIAAAMARATDRRFVHTLRMRVIRLRRRWIRSLRLRLRVQRSGLSSELRLRIGSTELLARLRDSSKAARAVKGSRHR